MKPIASGIGRVVDPRYSSNRFILIAAPTAGIAWMIWKLASEGDWWAALVRALVAGLTVFLAWALAREFDPDRPWTAGVAAAIAALIIGAGVPSLLIGMGTLMAARIVARTTGVAPRRGDLLAMMALIGVLGSSDTGLVAGLVLAAVLMADRFLSGGASRVSLPVGVIGAIAAVGAAMAWGALGPTPGLPEGPEWVVVPVAVIGLLAVGRPRRVAARGDFTSEALSVGRVRLGRVAGVLAAGLTFVWLGGPGLTAGSIVWASLAGTALPWPVEQRSDD